MQNNNKTKQMTCVSCTQKRTQIKTHRALRTNTCHRPIHSDRKLWQNKGIKKNVYARLNLINIQLLMCFLLFLILMWFLLFLIGRVQWSVNSYKKTMCPLLCKDCHFESKQTIKQLLQKAKGKSYLSVYTVQILLQEHKVTNKCTQGKMQDIPGFACIASSFFPHHYFFVKKKNLFFLMNGCR